MIIELNKRFYSKTCVWEGIRAFNSFFDAQTRESKEAIEIEISNCKHDAERSKGEFLNYCLGWMAQNEKPGCTGIGEQTSGEQTLKITNPDCKTEYTIQDHFIAPHKTARINDKIHIVTDFGAWTTVTSHDYESILRDEADEELKKQLEKDLIIVTAANYKTIIKRYHAKYLFLTQQPSLHIIEMTNKCDHNCIYCHAKEGNGETIPSKTLDKATADRILDFIFRTERKNISIELQGGEPTLNFDIVEHILKTASEKASETGKTAKFTIVTNLASITQEQIECLIKNECTISTSLDGPKNVHEKNRPSPAGPSHERTIHNIKKIKKTYNYPVGALLTVTKNSLPHWKEIIDQYVELGIGMIHIRPASYAGNAQKNSKEAVPSADEYNEFWKKSFEYLIELNKRGTVIKERLVTIILKKLLGIPVLYADLQSPCGMITGQIAYSADGRIYTCDIARGRDFFQIGTAEEESIGSIISKKDSKAIIASSINDLPACNICAYQPLCGLCPVMMKAETGSIISNPLLTEKCQTQKPLFEEVFKALADEEKKKILLSWTK